VRNRLKATFARVERLSPEQRRWLGFAAFGLAAVAALSLAAYWTRDRTFALDEWQWLVGRREWSAEALLEPDNGHLIALPLLVYKGLADLFGAESHVPFSLLILLLQALVPLLLYLNLARMIGPLIALLPATLMLFLGAGWEVLLNGGGIVNQFSLAAGLAMMLCLPRGDFRGDVVAGAFLALSLLSHSEGVAFAAAAAVHIVLRDRNARRLWVVLVPVVAYGVWAVWAQKYDQTSILAYSVGSVVSAVFDQLAAGLAAVTGTFRQAGAPDLETALYLRIDRAAPLVFVLVALIVWRIARGPRPSPALWSALILLGAYTLLVALGINEVRNVESSRYAYTAAAMILLVLGGLAKDVVFRPAWAWGAATATAVALIANVAEMRTGGTFLRAESDYNRANLAALELARARVAPGHLPERGVETLLPHRDLYFTAGDYFAATGEFGSPAYSESELLGASEAARQSADQELAAALGLEATTDRRSIGRRRLVPANVEGTSARLLPRGPCRSFRPFPTGTPQAEVVLPPGHGLGVRGAAGQELRIGLRRFADAYAVELPAPRASALLEPPRDASALPWRVSVGSDHPLLLCVVGDRAT
jgi:hypothetical protein